MELLKNSSTIRKIPIGEVKTSFLFVVFHLFADRKKNSLIIPTGILVKKSKLVHLKGLEDVLCSRMH